MGRQRALPDVDLTGQVIVVTGSNAGIGLETAVGLARLGATVVMTARNAAKGEAARAEVRERSGAGDRVVLGDLDLASFASIRRFADWVLATFDRLDVLVCNAGLITDKRQETVEGFEVMFGVNHVGHALLVDLLRERIVASAPSRIVVVSSLAHRWVRRIDRSDLPAVRGRFKGSRRYGESKLANLLFTVELARQLAGTGVTVNALHPGSINSHFGGDGDTGLMGWAISVFGRYVLRTPEEGAFCSIVLAASPDPAIAGTTGGYFVRGTQHTPSKAARDPQQARWLWDETERMIAAASGSPVRSNAVLGSGAPAETPASASPW